MSKMEGPRVGRHPGKMPGGVKLADCVQELIAIYGQMIVSKADRVSRPFLGMTALAAGMDFYDPDARDPYVINWYLQDAAKDAITKALSSGRLPTWTDYDGNFVELDAETLFGVNKWNPTYTVQTGSYVALNVDYGRDGPTRAECDGATLWVRKEDWPRIRGELIGDQERKFGTVLPDDMSQLMLGQLTTPVSKLVTANDTSAPLDHTWSLYEAVAWMGTHDMTFVEHQQSHHFPGTSAKNYGAVAWKRLEQSLADRATTGNAMMTADLARDRLLIACQTGGIRSTGIPGHKGDRRDVPARDFTGTQLWEGRGGSLHRVVAGIAEPARWYDLRFSTPDVQNLGKQVSDTPIKNPSPPLAVPIFATKKASEEWYRLRVAEADAAKISYSRQEDQLAGKQHGIGRDRMRELRATLAAHWSSGGAPTAEEQSRKRQFMKAKEELGE